MFKKLNEKLSRFQGILATEEDPYSAVSKQNFQPSAQYF